MFAWHFLNRECSWVTLCMLVATYISSVNSLVIAFHSFFPPLPPFSFWVLGLFLIDLEELIAY